MTPLTHLPSTDGHRHAVTGDGAAVDRYDAALDRLLRYHPDVVEISTALANDEPGFAMGQALAAYLSLTSTDVPDLPAARAAAANLAGLALDEHAAAHLRAIRCWLAGDWHGAAHQLNEVLIAWPTDLLALLVGHQLDFYLGDAVNLRDRIGRSMSSFDPGHPHYGFVLGMQAFGLEETGSYQEAEVVGLEALARHPDDVWAIHAVAHTYEMRGQVDEGIRFLRARQRDWGADNFFAVHNWWHLGLYYLEAGRADEVLGIYDAHLHHPGSAGVPLEMLDASAMLWRLFLDGQDTGGRFGPLAEAWATRTAPEPWYVFNDLHAVMALAGAGRNRDARAVIDRLTHYVTQAGPSRQSNHRMTADVGLPACRAALAFVEGRHGEVVSELLPIRQMLQRFGGSHAQRDALQRTVLESAIRSGQLDLAAALVSERLSVRATSVYGGMQRERLLRARGCTASAAAVAAEALKHQGRFAAAG